jgi:methionyl-tRNA synthetase
VWVEALPVYLTSIGYPNTEDPHFQKNWAQSLHLVGKDILRFHAVYWPALLMAAGLTPPKTVFAHGWWTNGGQKISKSLGNVIDPFELVEQFGQDAVRFFLMREVPLGQDGDFSHKALIQRTNSDLANAYGNLVQRVLSFIYKNADATLAGLDNLLSADQELLAHAQNLYGAIQKDMETYQVHKVLESIWQVIIAANKYVDEQAPWSLRKTDTERMNHVLAVLVDVIRRVTIFTQPFVPQAANQILDTLNINHGNRSFKALDITLPKGHQINEPKGAFPRIAEEA